MRQNAGNQVYNEDLIVSENQGLANVLVYVKASSPAIPPSAVDKFRSSLPVKIDQIGCMYRPHIIPLLVGQTLQIHNSDPLLHNIHALPKFNAGFNNGMATAGAMIEKKFTKPELGIRVKCDVHGWMQAYISVMENSFFAVTDETGAFQIPKLPPGVYLLEAWHEKLGIKSSQISISGPGDVKQVVFKY
jgi:hypothetical protein